MVNLIAATMIVLSLSPEAGEGTKDERETVRLSDSFFLGDLTGGVERPALLPHPRRSVYRIVIMPGARTSLQQYRGPLEPGQVGRGSDAQPPGGWHLPREHSQE